MTKLSRRLRISCVAPNAELGRDLGESNGSDQFRGWADSEDDEKITDSRGGDRFKGTKFDFEFGYNFLQFFTFPNYS